MQGVVQWLAGAEKRAAPRSACIKAPNVWLLGWERGAVGVARIGVRVVTW
jgi:hypothetical protein